MSNNNCVKICVYQKVCVVAIEVAAAALFRVFINIKVFPNNSMLGTVIGDGINTNKMILFV